MTLSRRLLGLLLTAAVALPATGCLSGPAPADHYYRLETGPPTGIAPHPLMGTLHVDRPRVDAVIGERQIAYRHDDSAEISQHPYQRWADSPSIMVQTAFVSYLQDAQLAPVVMPANARVEPTYVLHGRIERFERILKPTPAVIVEIDLTLNADGGAILVHKTYRVERPVGNDSLPSAAEAFGLATRDVLDEFIADVPAS